jgi:hypothetical protein
MGVPTSEVNYTSATTGRGNHEVHKGHVVALEKKKIPLMSGVTRTAVKETVREVKKKTQLKWGTKNNIT